MEIHDAIRELNKTATEGMNAEIAKITEDAIEAVAKMMESSTAELKSRGYTVDETVRGNSRVYQWRNEAGEPVGEELIINPPT